MPINLRYGQQAVARGFLSPDRLQTVLSKQQQLASQGKKVSVRMILEKAKLLSEDQLNQIDRDLNIKVVKKRTGKLDRPGVDARRQQQPARPMGAQDFAGEAVPQFSGMSGADPDATVFSPPPPDMQDRIRAERDRSKADARKKQEQEAAAFFGDDNASPFGNDPFADDAMAPEPMQPQGGGYGGGFGGGFNEMQPEPFGDEMQPEPFGGEMQPEPFGAYGEMQPDPYGGGGLQPQADGFGDESPFGADPFAGDAGEPQELSRMDSSPKLSSLPAEYDGFASPEDEELPTIGAFDEAPAAPQRRGPPSYQQPAPPSRQPAFASPMADLNPAGDGFDDFGNDIRSPEELDAAPSPGARGGGSLDATMFSPPPPGLGSPRQKTGAMEKTMFSPPPPGFHPRDRQPAPEPEPEPEPAMDDWGEPAMDAGAGFEDAVAGADMDATVFSPPPPEYEERRKDTSRKQAAAPRGRQGADDFGDVDLPVGKRMDDVPTSPSKGDEVHPLRRGVGTSSSGVNRTTSTRKPAARTPSSQIPVSVPADDVADELPQDDSPFAVPDDDIPDEVPAAVGASAKGKLPPKAPKKQTKKQTGKRELPVAQVDVPEEGGKKKKKTASRVILLFLLLLVIVLAILILPIAYPTHGIKPLDELRNHRSAQPIYEYVQDIYDTITGAPPRKKPGTRKEDPIRLPGNGANEPAGNAPAENSPAENSGG